MIIDITDIKYYKTKLIHGPPIGTSVRLFAQIDSVWMTKIWEKNEYFELRKSYNIKWFLVDR